MFTFWYQDSVTVMLYGTDTSAAAYNTTSVTVVHIADLYAVISFGDFHSQKLKNA